MTIENIIAANEIANDVDLTDWTNDTLIRYGNLTCPTKDHKFTDIRDLALNVAVTAELLKRRVL